MSKKEQSKVSVEIDNDSLNEETERKTASIIHWEIPASIGDSNNLLLENRNYTKALPKELDHEVDEQTRDSWIKKNISRLKNLGVRALNKEKLNHTNNPYDYAYMYFEITGENIFVFSFNSQKYLGTYLGRGKVTDKGIVVSYQVLFKAVLSPVYSSRRACLDSDEHETRIQLRIQKKYASSHEQIEYSYKTVRAKDLASKKGFEDVLLESEINTYFNTLRGGAAVAVDLLRGKLIGKSEVTAHQPLSIGYDEKTEFVVHKYYATNYEGKVFYLDESGLITADNGELILPPESSEKIIKPEEHDEVKDILQLYYRVFGNEGILVLTYVIMSWFKPELFIHLGYFPYLSFTGQPGTGKSSAIKECQNYQGFDVEGIAATGDSTPKGIVRSLQSRAMGFFNAVLEPGEKADINFNSLLPAYNHNATSTTAAYSNDNRTIDRTIKCSLGLVTNPDIEGEAQLKERFIRVPYSKVDRTKEDREKFRELWSIPKSKKAYIHPAIMKHAKEVMRGFAENFPTYNNFYKEAVQNPRVAEHYAILHFFFDKVILGICELKADVKSLILELARSHMLLCGYSQSHNAADDVLEYALTNINSLEFAEIKEKTSKGKLIRELRFSVREVLEHANHRLLQGYNSNTYYEAFADHRCLVHKGKRTRIKDQQTKLTIVDYDKLLEYFGDKKKTTPASDSAPPQLRKPDNPEVHKPIGENNSEPEIKNSPQVNAKFKKDNSGAEIVTNKDNLSPNDPMRLLGKVHYEVPTKES